MFTTSRLSFGFVNLKPIVPGHVLVCPKRVVKRFSELTTEEVADIWTLAQRIGKALEHHHRAESLTLTVQDGPAAGQTVAHVHIHILPRRKGDFEPNDKIYDEIDKSSQDVVASLETGVNTLNLDKERKPRSPDEMAAEAAELRKLFH